MRVPNYIKESRKSLLIVGPDIDTRGIGGVTIHVQRLLQYLDNRNFHYTFTDYKSVSFLTLLKAIYHNDLIHFHISRPVLLLALICYSRIVSKQVIFTLHGDYGRFSSINKWIIKLSIKFANIPIAINERSYDKCQHINAQTRLVPAFIPPQREENLQKEIIELVERLHAEGKTIFSTNAYNVAHDKYGNDIYGIDFLVQYFKNSQDRALIISDPSGNYHKQYTHIKPHSVFFIDYPHPYFELLKKVDYFIRNTSTDGDALSVKEAIYLGVPVLCTDVVDRPSGVRLFKYSDEGSFTAALKSSSSYSTKLGNAAETILRIYLNDNSNVNCSK